MSLASRIAWSLALFVPTVGFPVAGAANLENAPALRDTLSYVVRLGDVPLGISSVVSGVDSGRFRDQTMRTELRIERGDRVIAITQEVLLREDISGHLAMAANVMLGMGSDAWVDSLFPAGEPGAWRRTRSRGDRTTVDTIRCGPLMGPGEIERAFARTWPAGPERIRTLNPDEMVAASYKVSPTGIDTLAIRGGDTVICGAYDVSDSADGGSVRQWRDAKGILWREVEPSTGYMTERSEIGAAPSAHDGRAISLDVVSWKLVTLIGDAPDRRPCTFVLEPIPQTDSGGDGAPSDPGIPDGPGQTVTEDKTRHIWSIRLVPVPLPPTTEKDREGWRRDPGLARYLETGLIIDSASPLVRAFADSVAARASAHGEAGPTKEAILLERAVHERIRIRDLGTVYGTASQTLRDRQGDCTEHSVLLAAACRARGIPARVVAGFTPFTEGKMAWHQWTEVYLGTWAPLDATIGSGGPAPGSVGMVWISRPEEEMSKLGRLNLTLADRYRLRVLEEGKE
jgi:hypothetical protein